MNPITSILDRHAILVIDGALATELERRGYDLDDDLWSAKILLEQPDAIQQLHYDYFKAGADCAITASYQATIEGYSRHGLTDQEAIALLQTSVTLAVRAREDFWADEANRAGKSKPLVAASVGPYGAYLADGSEYRGNYGLTETELMDFHRPRMQALIEAGPDLLACETIPCLAEAQALVTLLEEFQSVHAWVSFSCRDGEHISEGQRLEECVRQLQASPWVAAMGVNCTAPKYIPSLIREASNATEKPVLVYPNSGETYDASRNAWDGQPGYASFSEEAKEWQRAGARLIGGCCRTTPEDIRGIAAWARN